MFYFGTCALLYNIWQLRAKTRARHENTLVPVDQVLVQNEMTNEILREFKRLRREREGVMEENSWAAYEFDEKL